MDREVARLSEARLISPSPSINCPCCPASSSLGEMIHREKMNVCLCGDHVMSLTVSLTAPRTHWRLLLLSRQGEE